MKRIAIMVCLPFAACSALQKAASDSRSGSGAAKSTATTSATATATGTATGSATGTAVGSGTSTDTGGGACVADSSTIDQAVQDAKTAYDQAYAQALAAKGLTAYEPRTTSVSDFAFGGQTNGDDYCWIDEGWNHATPCPTPSPAPQNGQFQEGVEYTFAGSSGTVAFVTKAHDQCGGGPAPLWAKNSAGDVYLVTQELTPSGTPAHYVLCGCHFTCGGAEQAPSHMLYLLPHAGSYKGPLTVPFTAPDVTIQWDQLDHTTPDGPAMGCPQPA